MLANAVAGTFDPVVTILEIVRTLGSFVGLLTGVAYFYDRIAIGRPVAYLSFKDDENESA
jgi:hypothetical protein